MALRTGDPAPEFSLTDQDGQTVRLSDFKGEHHVVIFFYPKDNTPICTKESCTFRDAYATIEAKDAVVLGISADPPESHSAFKARHSLPFSLLTDPGHQTAKAYGAMMFGLMAGRSTFVIDKDGVIQHVTNAQFAAEVHVKEAESALARLGSA